MKKAFSFLMVIVILVSALMVTSGTASADGGYITYKYADFIGSKGIVFIFDAPAGKNLKDATIWVGSDFYDLFCVYKADEGKIKCVTYGGLTKFEGQTGIIHLAGQIFYVIIPGRDEAPQTTTITVTCTFPEVTGAYVLFVVMEGAPQLYFIPGDTLQDVENQANDWLSDPWFQSFDIQGGLTCSELLL